MSELLQRNPYSVRCEDILLSEIIKLTEHHIKGCKEYALIVNGADTFKKFGDLPYLHVGIFKEILFKTRGDEIKHGRTLLSSATTSGISSKIVLDSKSSKLQAASTEAIHKHWIGDKKRPLLIIDSFNTMRASNDVQARIAAALSLNPLSSEIGFLVNDINNPTDLNFDLLEESLSKSNNIIVYGFTWILWLAWASNNFPDKINKMLKDVNISFVHSGGWKKLENQKVSIDLFEKKLLEFSGKESQVLDFYGLVEQNGVIYPMCKYGNRHVPIWANVIIREPYTLEPVIGKEGFIQLMNVLSYGSPNHNILTEDLGIIPDNGSCPCGLEGKYFILKGRVPKAELRGCSNAG